MTTHTDEPIEGPVTVAGHTWNIGDRVYFPCYSMGSITAFYRAPYAGEHSQIRAHALCDDGGMRGCCLDLQGQLLGYGGHAGSYLASSLAEREHYYKNKPKHPMPYEVMMMGRKKRVEEYTDDEYARSIDRETVTSSRRSAAAQVERQSVTSSRRSAAAQTRAPKCDTTAPLDTECPPIWECPKGYRWCQCEECKKWFPSKRYHAKTCGAKCRKALSRKQT